MKKVASLVGWLLLGAVATQAQAGPRAASDLSTKVLAPPGMGVSPSPQRMEEIPGFRRTSAWERFQARVSPGQPLYALFDQDGQRPAIIELSVPWIPGSANSLRPEEVAGFGQEPVLAVLERLGRDFVREHEDLLGISEADLVLDETASQGTRPSKVGNATVPRLWHLVFDWAPHGTRVQGAGIVFRVSRGNLVQISTRNLGDREAVPRADGGIGAERAREILGRHVGGLLPDDTFLKAELRILPFAQPADPVRNVVTTGRHRAYRAAWVLAFRRGQDEEVWEGAVDAKTGEVLYFGSTALHGYAYGKVRPHGNPAGEVQVPFPYVDYRPASTPQVDPTYAGFDGSLYNVETVISYLQGRTAKVNDGCGGVELTGYNLDFGGASPPGSTDCNSQSGGDGNTAAARTAYYWVTWGKEWARSYLPGLSWLFPSTANAATTIRTNDVGGSPCVAFYTESSDTLVFRKSGELSGGWRCRNSGELVSHIFHEFGHGLDHNDGIPIGDADRSSTEAYGDIVAFLVTRDSCIGRGFDRGSNQAWCGFHSTQRSYNCEQCDGFRDVDWRAHVEDEPHTPATNLTQCENDPGRPLGPCGKQRHCETSPATEAMWDLVLELQARGYSENDAWEKATDLFLSSRPSGDDMFTCANANGSREGGTPGGSLYHTLRAADDDCDGNPNDGTANAAAIYAALARHDIAVGSASDPRNQNDPCDEAPVADFTFNCSGRTCSFNGSSSTDDFGIVSWTWSFGDSTSPITENDPLTSHTYASSNHFQVTLTVTDTLGQTGSMTRTVTANLLPVASFNFNCTGLSCSFDASSSTDDNPISYYLWSWGDGTPNTGYAATANHAFAAAGSYTVTVTVADSLGGQSASSRLVTVTTEAAPNPIRYFALPPCRLLDTRGGTILTSGTARVVQVTGACGIPASARSVSLNATVVSPTGSGRLSFYPGDQAASSATTVINFAPATSPRANSSMPRLGANGTLGVYPSVSASPGQVHLILDVQGYFSEDAAPAAGAQGPLGYQNVTPCRIADTRPSSPLTAGSTRTFTVQGVCGIPAGTPAASLNFTVAQASGGGHITLFPANTGVPLVSAINFNAGTSALANGARANLAPTTPDLAAYFGAAAGATVHAIVDAHGYFRAGAPLSYRPITPCRAVDTRVSSQGAPILSTGTTRSFQIRGNCGVPSRAKAAFLNVIVVTPTTGGHLTVFPSGTAQPSVPNLNFDANEPALGNGMIVPLSTAANDLSINLFAPPAGSAHVVVDVFGWFDDPPPTACFTWSCNLRSCTFDSSCSSDNQSISTRTWNFGDGTPTATGLIVTHNYAVGGPKQVTLTVADNIGQTDDEVKTVLVNRPPSAVSDFANTPPGVPVDINVLANDSDPDGDAISVSTWSSPSVQGGIVIKNANGTLRYSPPAGFQGSDSFTYRISDGKEESAPATVTVSVNNPPDARDDGWSTYTGGQTNIPYSHLLANDYDRDGDALTVTGISTAGLIGTLDCSSGSYCRYTSPPTYQGTTSFTYSASDNKGGTDPATVRIKVGVANADPVPQDDLFETVRNTPVTFMRAALLLNDSDPNGDVLSVPMVYRDPITSFGTVSCSAANYVCTYTPPAGFTGVDILWYQAHDGVGFANARVRILVRPPSPAVLDAREDQIFTTTTVTYLSYAWMTSNDYDPEGGPLTVVSVDTTGLVGTLDCTTFTTGCEYTRGTSNPTRFRYTVRDPQGNLDTTTVTLKPGNWSFNQIPVIASDQLSTRTNTPLAFSIFDLLRNDFDADNDQLDFSFYFASTYGRVSCTTPAYFCTYTPNAGFTGTDTLTYWANDRNNSVQGSVTMTVLPVVAKDAQIVSQTVPAGVFARQSYPVSMRLKNVGTQAWSLVGPQCNAFRLGSVNPYDNTTWGSSRAELPATVPPGGEVTVSFTITAPATPGNYNFQRRMVHECVEWFGDLSPNVVVAVSP